MLVPHANVPLFLFFFLAQLPPQVVEDAPAGVKAALAAGMRVVAVPSVAAGDGDAKGKWDPADFAGATEVMGSLLDWRPEAVCGLPAFEASAPAISACFFSSFCFAPCTAGIGWPGC